jgi:hypothetical protein
MLDEELAKQINQLHPKNAVRLLEAISEQALRGLPEAEAREADSDLIEFAAALDLQSGWQERAVTELPKGSPDAAADAGGEAAKQMLKALAATPELRPFIEENLGLTDDSGSVTLALGVPILVTTAWLLVSGQIEFSYTKADGVSVKYVKKGLTPEQQVKGLPDFVKGMLDQVKAGFGLGGSTEPTKGDA